MDPAFAGEQKGEMGADGKNGVDLAQQNASTATGNQLPSSNRFKQVSILVSVFFRCCIARTLFRRAASKTTNRPQILKSHTKMSAPKLPIVIRRLEPSDCEAMAKMFTYPKVIFGSSQVPFPSSQEWKKKLEVSCSNSDGHHLCATVDGEFVGSIGLTIPPRARMRHVGQIGIAVRDDYHSRGIGTALMAAIIDLADNWLNLFRLELDVYTDNVHAIALYKKFNFEIEGTCKCTSFREGKYADTYTMARLKPGFPKA
jgi:putative acetyltransferase